MKDKALHHLAEKAIANIGRNFWIFGRPQVGAVSAGNPTPPEHTVAVEIRQPKTHEEYYQDQIKFRQPVNPCTLPQDLSGPSPEANDRLLHSLLADPNYGAGPVGPMTDEELAGVLAGGEEDVADLPAGALCGCDACRLGREVKETRARRRHVLDFGARWAPSSPDALFRAIAATFCGPAFTLVERLIPGDFVTYPAVPLVEECFPTKSRSGDGMPMPPMEPATEETLRYTPFTAMPEVQASDARLTWSGAAPTKIKRGDPELPTVWISMVNREMPKGVTPFRIAAALAADAIRGLCDTALEEAIEDYEGRLPGWMGGEDEKRRVGELLRWKVARLEAQAAGLDFPCAFGEHFDLSETAKCGCGEWAIIRVGRSSVNLPGLDGFWCQRCAIAEGIALEGRCP